MAGRTEIKSASKENGNSQTPKTIIITSMITAITTIAVSFIAIVPQLRKSDSQYIQKLKEQVVDLGEHAQASRGSYELKGQLLGRNSVPLGKAEVYLIPATGSEHMMTSDDGGNFVFDRIDSGPHWIVVRDPTSMSTRGLIGDEKLAGRVPLVGVTIEYELIKR